MSFKSDNITLQIVQIALCDSWLLMVNADDARRCLTYIYIRKGRSHSSGLMILAHSETRSSGKIELHWCVKAPALKSGSI